MTELSDNLKRRFSEIRCDCGNAWPNFMFVTLGDGTGKVSAACKSCGKAQHFTEEKK